MRRLIRAARRLFRRAPSDPSSLHRETNTKAIAAYMTSGNVSDVSDAFQNRPEALRQEAMTFFQDLADSGQPRDATFVIPLVHAGRIDHYHHFLNGFLLPFILRMESAPLAAESLCLPDCGAMNTILDDVTAFYGLAPRRFPNFLIPDLLRTKGLNQAVLFGHDRSNVAGHWLHAHELRAIHGFADRFAGVAEHKDIDVLLINRGAPDDYYRSAHYSAQYKSQKIGLAGSERRSIANFDALGDALAKAFRVEILLPETLSLAEQIALFRRARVVVAQHGAALNGIVWSNERIGVIDITPMSRTGESLTYFRIMSEVLGHDHVYAFQQDDHTDVDIAHVIAAARTLLA